MTAGWDVDFLGDSALLLSPPDADPWQANARVHALAARLRAAGLAGVHDIVPGMRDLVVHVDAVRCEIAALTRVITAPIEDVAPADPTPVAAGEGSFFEIPVVYGGDAGPDLRDVARACALTPEEVCRRHAAIEYRVCFVGFLPGFPYLGPVDPALQLPRRATPRPRVPAGSVAIAGEYSGIYPSESPGGWHLIGRTDVRLFDLDAHPPARLAAGARVRFVPV